MNYYNPVLFTFDLKLFSKLTLDNQLLAQLYFGKSFLYNNNIFTNNIKFYNKYF